MRDIVLVGFFLAMIPFAMRRTWVAVMLWTWVSIMNPHKLAWGFAVHAPFAMAAAGCALISLVVDRQSNHFPKDNALRCLLAFLVWCCFTTLFAIYPGDSYPQLIKVLKIQFMTIVAAMAIRERRHLEWFIWINALSIGFYGVKGGLFTLATGGGFRVWGPAGGFIEGNNEIGLAMTMTVPLLYYLRAVAVKVWLRHSLLLVMLLTAVAALGTQSRGALLAMSAMALLLWSRGERKLLLALIVPLVAAAIWMFMPESWHARMSTISSYEQDSSAMGRINAWMMALNLANDRFIGGGFSIITPELFSRYAPIPEDIHAQHSIYFQVLGEHGWLGLLLYLGVGYFTWRNCSWIRAQSKTIAEARWLYQLAGMIQVSMAGFAVGGAFLSLAYFDLPFNVMVMSIAGRYWLQEQRWAVEKEGAFNAAGPNSRRAVW